MAPHASRDGSRIVRCALGATLMIMILVVGGLVIWAHREGWSSVRRGIDAASSWLALWRITLAAVLIGGWPLWVRRLAVRYRWREAHRQRVLRLRWPTAAWLLLIELVLVQHVLGGIAA